MPPDSSGKKIVNRSSLPCGSSNLELSLNFCCMRFCRLLEGKRNEYGNTGNHAESGQRAHGEEGESSYGSRAGRHQGLTENRCSTPATEARKARIVTSRSSAKRKRAGPMRASGSCCFCRPIGNEGKPARAAL